MESGTSLHVRAARRVFWGAIWLAFTLVALKIGFLGTPPVRPLADVVDYLRSIFAITYVDMLFVAVVWAIARALIEIAGERRWPARLVTAAFVGVAALSCVYAAASIVMFGVFGGFLTYPMVKLVGDMRMLSSSAATYLTPSVLLALVGLPLTYVLSVLASVRFLPPRSRAWQPAGALAVLGLWIGVGYHTYAADWTTRQQRKIADNAHWVLASSWWKAIGDGDPARIPEQFPAGDLDDFAPMGVKVKAAAPAVVPSALKVSGSKKKLAPPRRPMNVILIVLESVAARWTGLSGGQYETTPNLKAESAHAISFNNFYAHIGRSSNSLGAMLLSTFPKLDFQDFTEEFPQPDGTPLPELFRERGYRTAFMMPSYLSWANWGSFLKTAGFSEVRDSEDFTCAPPLSSWGVEDRCMVDAMRDWLDNDDRPFFLMGWAHQTHHPYEPSPDAPVLDLMREGGIDDAYDLSRYLNVMHETDLQIERLFETVRSSGLAENTMIVVVGDHGQAFGYPHDSYLQGRSVYEEDVHVPFMIWSPLLFKSAALSDRIGSHVDLAPTIAELAGLGAAPDWRGRSMFASERAPRAYFYAAEDHFTLGVREGDWKYVFDLREGVEELYDLAHDPMEQRNLAKAEPARAERLRQRLAAWAEANRRQYLSASGS